MDREKVNKSVLMVMVLFISALFLSMIRHFLMAILLAGIFSAMFHPLYRILNRRLKGRRTLASVITLITVVVVILLPLGGLLGVVTAQAIKVGQSITPWVQNRMADPGGLSQFTGYYPFLRQDRTLPAGDLSKSRGNGGNRQQIPGEQSLRHYKGNGQFPVYDVCSAVLHVLLSDGRGQAVGEDPLLPAHGR